MPVNDVDAMTFGDWVRRLRRTLDLTQDELARQVGCATDTIKKIEAGARRPSKTMAERLANCLDMPAERRAVFLSAARLNPGLPIHDARAISMRLGEPAHSTDDSPDNAVSAHQQRSNLPAQLTPFIGREREIADLLERMKTVRLLTLTGAGGVGKTRLALEVVAKVQDDFADGTWLVELASLADPVLVPQIVSNAFSLIDHPGRTPTEALINFLGDKHLLLVIDNCEHLIAACARLIEALLRACPGLTILATSREALRVPSEVTWRVPSLATPNPSTLSSLEQVEDVFHYEAIQLFVQHATMAHPGFTLTPENAGDVAQICHRLDGIPLAIEMAAAQISVLSAGEIAASLSDQLALLTSGSRTALLRHQTLRATLDWSYTLLSAAEQSLLARLSVFAGGWTAEAAKVVCADEQVLPLLLQLVHKSLVVAMPLADQTRYRLLEVVRQYTAEKLATQSVEDEHALRDRHVSYYTAFAEAAEPWLLTGEALLWLQRLEFDYDNMRAAINWAFERGNASAGLRLVAALTVFWRQRNYVREQRWQLHRALRESSPAERTVTRAKVLNSAGRLACAYREVDEAQRLLDEALSIDMELNDQASVAQSQLARGHEAFIRGDNASAQACVEQALMICHDLGDSYNVAFAHIHLAALTEDRGDDREAKRLLEMANEALESLGEQRLQAQSLFRLARLALRAPIMPPR